MWRSFTRTGHTFVIPTTTSQGDEDEPTHLWQTHLERPEDDSDGWEDHWQEYWCSSGLPDGDEDYALGVRYESDHGLHAGATGTTGGL